MSKITVGIIGAGSIGALKPDNIDSLDTCIPLTHTHAVFMDNNFDLLWISDKSQTQMHKANKKWETKISNKSYLQPVDVAVVATPTNTHLQVVEKICFRAKENQPKIIILEKPAGNNIHEATKIDYLTKQAGIKVFVNYGRRYCSIIQKIAENIKRETIQSIVFYYTRGFVRDGSHAIDMFNLFAGEFIEGFITNADPIIDYDESDPTYAALLKYSKCPQIYLIPLDGREYDIFEMEIKTNKASWYFGNHFCKTGMMHKQIESTYGNYFSMGMPDGIYWNTDLEYSLVNLYEEINSYLKKDEAGKIDFKFSCTMKEAIRTHVVIDRLITQYKIAKGDE